MEFKLTDAQAYKIVNSMLDGGFFISGYGNFFITREEAKEVIKKAFERQSLKNVSEYHKILSKQKGL